MACTAHALDSIAFELDFANDDNIPLQQPCSSPKHHRTSSIADTPASSNSGSISAAGSTNSSLNGFTTPASVGSFSGGVTNSSSLEGSFICHSNHSSTDGGLGKQQQTFAGGGISMMTLQLPDFASMLPSECSFAESTTDDCEAAPTPHTPVVTSIFDGDGLPVASARNSSKQCGYSAAVDEFDSIAFENMPNTSSSNSSSHHSHGVHHFELHQMTQDGWEPASFTSLLPKRTLSAVMEVDNEGQDDDVQQQQQMQEQQHLQLQPQLRQQQQQEHTLAAQAETTLQQQQGKVASSASNSPGQHDAAQAAAAADADLVDVSSVELEAGSDHSSCCCTGSSGSSSSSSSVFLSMPPETLQQPVCSTAQQQQCKQQQPDALTGPQLLVTLGGEAPRNSVDSLGSLADAAAVELHVCPKAGHGSKADKLASCKHADIISPGSVNCVTNCAVGLAAAAAAVDVEAVGLAAVAPTVAQEEEEDEWAVANRERLQELKQQEAVAPAGAISYAAAEAALLSADMRCHRATVLQSIPRPPSWLKRKLKQWLVCGGSACSTGAVAEGSSEHEQLVLLLSLAKTAFDDSSEIHVAILQAVYSSLTGKSQLVPRFGHHWGAVGFQGDDPATDLRGVGMLGLLHLLYLPHHNAAAAQKLYQLSVSARQEFPLAIVSLNLTRWTLSALRAGSLSQHARRLGSYMAAANHLYCGAFYEFYGRWCQGRTMRDAGNQLKQLEEYCKRHPAKLLKLAAAPDKAIAAAERQAWEPS